MSVLPLVTGADADENGDCLHGLPISTCSWCRRDRIIYSLTEDLAAARAEAAQWQESSGQTYVRATEAEMRAEELERDFDAARAEIERLREKIGEVRMDKYAWTMTGMALCESNNGPMLYCRECDVAHLASERDVRIETLTRERDEARREIEWLLGLLREVSDCYFRKDMRLSPDLWDRLREETGDGR